MFEIVSELEAGLYDRIVDELLSEQLTSLEAKRLRASVAAVDPAEVPERVAGAIAEWVRETVAAASSDDRSHVAVRLAATMLNTIRSVRPSTVDPRRRLVEPVSRLVAIERLAPTNEPIRIGQPITPLRDTVLMTNARDQPAVGHEIKAEIDSADRIDIVLAFIRWTGIRDLVAPLRRHVEAGKQLRILTTTYTGSTELRAVQALAELGAQIKVSYETGATRLHAKAWLFDRNTGFSTVYIGSSNLTFSAQVTGLEWNVRASEHRNPDLIAAFERTFNTYWADPHFEDFHPQRFTAAVSDESSLADDRILTPFDIQPYPFQRQMLEGLQVERQRGHQHNLVVAATGTGKTVLAALDYRQLRTELDRARLLFVAHRDRSSARARPHFATFSATAPSENYGSEATGPTVGSMSSRPSSRSRIGDELARPDTSSTWSSSTSSTTPRPRAIGAV